MIVVATRRVDHQQPRDGREAAAAPATSEATGIACQPYLGPEAARAGEPSPERGAPAPPAVVRGCMQGLTAMSQAQSTLIQFGDASIAAPFTSKRPTISSSACEAWLPWSVFLLTLLDAGCSICHCTAGSMHAGHNHPNVPHLGRALPGALLHAERDVQQWRQEWRHVCAVLLLAV